MQMSEIETSTKCGPADSGYPHLFSAVHSAFPFRAASDVKLRCFGASSRGVPGVSRPREHRHTSAVGAEGPRAGRRRRSAARGSERSVSASTEQKLPRSYLPASGPYQRARTALVPPISSESRGPGAFPPPLLHLVSNPTPTLIFTSAATRVQRTKERGGRSVHLCRKRAPAGEVDSWCSTPASLSRRRTHSHCFAATG